MHVAYIHQHFISPKKSGGTRPYEMSKALVRAGHEVTIICGNHNDGSGPMFGEFQGSRKLELDGINIHSINSAYSNRMGFYRRLRSFGAFASQATHAVCETSADVVFASSTPLTVGIPGMRGARKLAVPFVFEVRDLWPELLIALNVLRNPVLKVLAAALERRIYRAAKHIVALSPGMKDGVCKTGIPRERVSVIPNGCDLELFQPSTNELNDDRFGPPDRTRFVFAGAHGVANGLDAVLDAATVLKQRGSKGIQFVFVGHGPERERLIERSKRDGTDDFVSWIPSMSKEEFSRVLPLMDVGMMILKNIPAFRYGTSPNKFFDYIASGLPVLNNYSGWVADMINESQCGVAIEGDSAVAFADAVEQLRDGDRTAMGNCARKLAEARFDRRILGDALVSTLESVVNATTTTTSQPVPVMM